MKIIFTILGLICVGLGAVGIIIPVLLTVPFLLATTVLFASRRFAIDSSSRRASPPRSAGWNRFSAGSRRS